MEDQISQPHKLNPIFWIGLGLIVLGVVFGYSNSTEGVGAISLFLLLAPWLILGIILMALGFVSRADSKAKRNAWVAVIVIATIFASMFYYMSSGRSCGDGVFARNHKIICFVKS